jgi:hypothetical protein
MKGFEDLKGKSVAVEIPTAVFAASQNKTIKVGFKDFNGRGLSCSVTIRSLIVSKQSLTRRAFAGLNASAIRRRKPLPVENSGSHGLPRAPVRIPHLPIILQPCSPRLVPTFSWRHR